MRTKQEGNEMVSWRLHSNGVMAYQYRCELDEQGPHPLTGTVRLWYKNAVPRRITPYVKGKEHGVEYRYTHRGKLKKATLWEHGKNMGSPSKLKILILFGESYQHEKIQ